MKIAAIEAGGTKFVCAIVNDKGEVLERITIPTTTPAETMSKVINFFKLKEFSVIGLGCFGPIDLNKQSKTYGYITSTPKVAWQNYNILGTLQEAFDVKIGLDTDVNGAALGEYTFGSAKRVDSCLYITVGTGIGAGAVINGKMLNGLMHPEMGHIKIKRHQDDDFEGMCPFHHDCLEGLAAGPAIEARVGKKANQLPTNHPIWNLESYYLAQALMNYILVLSPEKIILGGGVMHQEHLYAMIRKQLAKQLNSYIINDILDTEDYITKPQLGNDVGIIGCAMIGLAEME